MGQRRTDFLKVRDGFRILAFRNVLDSQEVDLTYSISLNQSYDIWIDILLCFGFAPQMKISRANCNMYDFHHSKFLGGVRSTVFFHVHAEIW